MTLPGVGTTAGAQSSNLSIAATADALGNIKFIGPSGIGGSTITCVVTIPSAPNTAGFVATLGTPNGMGVALQTWGGASTVGKFQIGVGQTLVVTGTGLTPGASYSCTFAQIIDVGSVAVVVPEPNSFVISTAPKPVSLTFAATGATQTWTAPPNVTSVTLDMAGARGGNSFAGAILGGLGDRLQATLAVIPGTTYTVWVAKQGTDSGATGGFGIAPGGTSAANGATFGGAGGGASGISPTAAAGAAVAIAGGGGGAGGSAGGGGGSYPTGIAAPNAGGAGGGQGGTQLAGGAGGTGATVAGAAGSTLQGGNAFALTAAFVIGGGGGGFFGGGTGAAATPNSTGGGGGSGFHGAQLSNIVDTPAFQNGDGYVTLSYFT